MSPQEKASRNMLALAGTAQDLAAGNSRDSTGGASPSAAPPSTMSSATEPKVGEASAAKLHRVAALLRRHVDLLTPGLAARVDQEPSQSPSAAASEIPPSPAATPPTADSAITEVAVALAGSANHLLDASEKADSADVPAVLGAGIEQRLAAQQLASGVPGDGAAKALPKIDLPEADAAWKEAAKHRLPEGSCATAEPTQDASTSAAATAGTGSATADASPENRADATALDHASDAAFRLAYGYQMAAVKQPGASTHKGWMLSTASAELGHQLEDLLPGGCSPVREPAYQLPDGFAAKPIASVATAEGQLAALLRDAAAASTEQIRPALILESWLSAERSYTLAGTIPKLT